MPIASQELGKVFVKAMKAVPLRLSTSSLSPFSVALALSVARIHHFEDVVSHVLTSYVVQLALAE